MLAVAVKGFVEEYTERVNVWFLWKCLLIQELWRHPGDRSQGLSRLRLERARWTCGGEALDIGFLNLDIVKAFRDAKVAEFDLNVILTDAKNKHILGFDIPMKHMGIFVQITQSLCHLYTNAQLLALAQRIWWPGARNRLMYTPKFTQFINYITFLAILICPHDWRDVGVLKNLSRQRIVVGRLMVKGFNLAQKGIQTLRFWICINLNSHWRILKLSSIYDSMRAFTDFIQNFDPLYFRRRKLKWKFPQVFGIWIWCQIVIVDFLKIGFVLVFKQCFLSSLILTQSI